MLAYLTVGSSSYGPRHLAVDLGKLLTRVRPFPGPDRSLSVPDRLIM